MFPSAVFHISSLGCCNIDASYTTRALDLLFKLFTSWCLRIVPALFLRDMYRALVVPCLKVPPNKPQMHKVILFPRLLLSAGTTSPYKCIPPIPETLTYCTYPATLHHPPVRPYRQLPQQTLPKTYLKSTLNATPDSFSNGSTHNTLPTALSYARESVSARAAIIDIGGYSTRPGAAFVCVQEEIDRVVPIVQAIRLAASMDEEGGRAEDREAEAYTDQCGHV